MATVWNAESALVNPAEFMAEYVSLLELSFEAGCEGGRKLTDAEQDRYVDLTSVVDDVLWRAEDLGSVLNFLRAGLSLYEPDGDPGYFTTAPVESFVHAGRLKSDEHIEIVEHAVRVDPALRSSFRDALGHTGPNDVSSGMADMLERMLPLENWQP